jgi:hypothetical protein
MTLAFDAMLELARRMGATYEGDLYKSTSEGTTTTLISTTLTQVDDYWNGGTLFVKSGTLANISREITDFTASSDTVTVTTAFHATTKMPTASQFAITKNDYPRHVLMRALNSALRWWGDIAYYDDTTLDTAASTLEYSLPAAAVRDLRNVMIANSTSSPYDFHPFPYWYVNRGSGKLVFRVQPAYTYNIRLIYMAPHAAVDSDDDAISTHIHIEALYAYAMAELYMWKVQTTGHDDRKWIDLYNQYLQLAEKYKRENPVPSPSKDPTYMYEPAAPADFNPYRISSS